MFKIGLDIGYGYTKIATEDGKEIIFPSLAKKGEQLNLDDLLGATDDYISVINGSTWYIGDMAQKESIFASRAFEQTNRYNDDAFKAMLATALAVASKDTEQELLVVTGLPLSLYRTSRREFQNFLQDFTARVEIKDYSKNVKIRDAVVFPQAGGIFFSPSCIDLVENNLIDNSNIVVIDIGYRTTDCAVFHYNKGSFKFLVEKSFTIDTGMSALFVNLSRRAADKARIIDISLEEAEIIFRTGKCYNKTEEIDMTKEIEELKNNIVKNIYDQFITKSSQGSMKDMILLAGGGSIALKDNLLNTFSGAKQVAENQMANALGFLVVANKFDIMG